MKILISNDDGIDSPGILRLAEAMKGLGEVTVVAPHRERSTAGHSLTLHKPLRVASVGPGLYAATGTPADCIYLGIREVLKDKPDLILSGINAGANLGTDIHYSGTVAAAREGALMNIPSIAFSLVDDPKALSKEPSEIPGHKLDFESAALVARRVVEHFRGIEFPSHTLLNVNIPNLPVSRVKGMALARQGFRFYVNEVLRRTDPRGRDYYWIGGPYSGYEPSTNSDCYALEQGLVSVTPLTIDCTHQGFFSSLREQIFPEGELPTVPFPGANAP